MLTKFCAVIFDLDGVVINSEPLWKKAGKEVLTNLGLSVSDFELDETTALSTKDFCEFWYAKQQWNGLSIQEAEHAIENRTLELIAENDIRMPGINKLIEIIANKGLKLGLASNSSHKYVTKVLNKLNFINNFNVVSSAEDVNKGKPEPDIYFHVSKKLMIKPENCCVIEDSIVGLYAAKKAGMFVIAIPPKETFDDERYNLADLKIKNFNELLTEIIKI